MVIDDVEQHHEPARMRGDHQAFQVLRRAVARIRRERQHAVVTPVALAWKIRDRHELDRGHAQAHEVVQPLDRRVERAFRRERADVQLVNHRLFPRAPAPRSVGPFEGQRVDERARGVDVLRIRARRRVRHADAVVDPVAVARAGREIGYRGAEPAALFRGSGCRWRPRSCVISSATCAAPGAHSRKRATPSSSSAPNGIAWRRFMPDAPPAPAARASGPAADIPRRPASCCPPACRFRARCRIARTTPSPHRAPAA